MKKPLTEKQVMKELEGETKKAKKSTLTVSNNDTAWMDTSDAGFTPERTYKNTGIPGKNKDPWEPIKVTEFRDGTPNKRMKLYIMFLKSSVLLQVLLALTAIVISLGLMVAGVESVLDHADKTGVAILVTVLLSYCILVNVKRFVR